MVDELTTSIQSDMHLSEGTETPIDVAVTDKVSPSMNAYQHYFIGVDYFNDSHFDEAIIELEKAIDLDSTFSRAYYKLALSQWWTKSDTDNESIENAQKSLSKIINGSWYRTTKEKLLAQGAVELLKQNYNESEDLYLQLIDFLPDEKEAWYGLGEVYYGFNNYERASEAFERAVEIDPNFTIVYRRIYDIYDLQKKYDSGIIRATQLMEDYPESVWGSIFLGQMLMGKGDYLQAREIFEGAIQHDNTHPIIYQKLNQIQNNMTS